MTFFIILGSGDYLFLNFFINLNPILYIIFIPLFIF